MTTMAEAQRNAEPIPCRWVSADDERETTCDVYAAEGVLCIEIDQVGILIFERYSGLDLCVDAIGAIGRKPTRE